MPIRWPRPGTPLAIGEDERGLLWLPGITVPARLMDSTPHALAAVRPAR